MKIPGSGMYSFFQQNVGKYAGELNKGAILEYPATYLHLSQRFKERGI